MGHKQVLLTLAEARRRAKVANTTIYRWVNKGLLRAVARFNGSGIPDTCVDRAALDRLARPENRPKRTGRPKGAKTLGKTASK